MGLHPRPRTRVAHDGESTTHTEPFVAVVALTGGDVLTSSHARAPPKTSSTRTHAASSFICPRGPRAGTSPSIGAKLTGECPWVPVHRQMRQAKKVRQRIVIAVATAVVVVSALAWVASVVLSSVAIGLASKSSGGTDVAVAGELLSLAESAGTATITGTLPADVPRLTDPGAVCSGLIAQSGTDVTCIPATLANGTVSVALVSIGAGAALAVNGTTNVRGLVVAGTAGAAAAAVGDDVVLTINATNTVLRAIGGGVALAVNGTDIVRGLVVNGTADVSLTQINDDVLMTVNIPADVARLCGVSCGPGNVLAVAPNGTCLLCNTGVQAASVMRTCGTCPQFASMRLAANRSCYECLSIPASSIFNGGGDVGVQLGSNDTLVYSTLKTFMADPTVSSSGSSSYTYTSGWYKTTTFPVDYPGNSHGLTLYQIDIGMNILLSFTGSPGSQIAIVYDFSSIVPGWVLV